MADPYSDFPELSAEAQANARRRKIAEAMMQRGQTPLESMGMAGGAPIPISWTQGLSQLANAYVGGEQMRDTETADKVLADKYTGMETDAMSKVRDAMLGTPEKQAPFQADNPFGEDLGTNTTVTPAQATTPEGRRQAIIDAQLSRFPKVQKFGAIQQKYDEMQQAQDLAREQRKWEIQQKAQDKLDQIELQAREGRISRAEADARAAELRKSLVTMAGAMRQPPAVTPVTIQDPNNPNATIVIDGRTRQVLGVGPKMTEAGKMENKRQFGMSGLNDALDQAESLLSGTSGKPLPTNSTIGTLYDTAAGMVGASPEGAAEAQTLKAIGGALTSKMPRMEGPQSDKDTQLYKEMAAVVGDSTVPRTRRLAALAEVRRLWGKYETGQQGAPSKPTAPSAPGKVRTVDW